MGVRAADAASDASAIIWLGEGIRGNGDMSVHLVMMVKCSRVCYKSMERLKANTFQRVSRCIS